MNISIVIVTYNSMKWIEKCIESIKKSSIATTIIVVDNKSSDRTVSFLNTKFGNDIILLQSEINLGFGKGNNIGIKKALELNADYVFLLNQDTIIEPELIEKLVNVANKNKQFGIISPVHLEYDGNELEYYFSSYLTTHKTPHFLRDHIKNENIQPIYETHFVNAAAWLIPVEVLKKVGGFDPIFQHYGEDDNFGQRVRYHGFKIGIVPGIFIKHDSKMRNMPANFLFSKKYYDNFCKGLMIKYADINNPLPASIFISEKNTILFEALTCILKFNFTGFKNHYKKIKLLKNTFHQIEISRQLNKYIISKFIYLQ